MFMWPPENISQKDSSISAYGKTFVRVKITKITEIEIIKSNKPKPVLSLQKPPVKKVGRPDNKFKVREAYKRLREQGLINYDASLLANVDVIQKAVMEIFPDMTSNYGIGAETIRLAVGKQFEADKSSN